MPPSTGPELKGHDPEWAGEGWRPHSPARLFLLGFLALLAFAGLVALGTWQVERRAWKLDLIQRVESRVHAPPAAPPGVDAWPGVTAARDEYRHVRVMGRFLHDRETLVQANTNLGAGFWVLTPLRDEAGFTVLVNRGFVPGDRRDPAGRAEGQVAGPVTVTGLLRVTEPGGSFLRSNRPAEGRWYSRDVAAIAAVRGLPGPVAPYFIDADAVPNPGGLPVGGLTVISFPNNHLVYAITWYALALMVAAATAYVAREEWRARRQA
ncbi:Cytochrome c oxidase assembly protein Surf1 [Roseomonas mucosa]|uniref:SURF1 family protein n=1 Tax=Roseomonas TaxID=125216 RepID=UPI00095B0BD3|nr:MULTISPECIES: SURF1 family protein [Roseomonas]MDT8267097.1 SURF1 family protein [Roseomonas sp. DSM 102946]ATR22340.1 SURF1 family protein [Roseomonas sp. FDAARGOS_362]USQ72981.1 SURF1 family protein [Roseomonas mucosa]UZO95123.1 Cytochrome c oxidase assembly protein Surf1 [Roseomonas mucosa]GAV34030.1 SURF1 family protein [Roseomonas sp. TAS13]